MTTTDDKNNSYTALRELFDVLDAPTPGYSKEQRKADAAAFRAQVDEAVAELEAKFADRGLRFTEGFRGACPMQAYGWIDGERFYFRYRSDIATLRVGLIDPVQAQKNYEYERTVKAQSMVDFVAGHREMDEAERKELLEKYAAKAVLATNDDVQVFPTAVSAVAHLGGIQGNPYAGALNDKKEMLTTFIRLVNGLEAPEKEGNV